jgi:hypothetical protein
VLLGVPVPFAQSSASEVTALHADPQVLSAEAAVVCCASFTNDRAMQGQVCGILLFAAKTEVFRLVGSLATLAVLGATKDLR